MEVSQCQCHTKQVSSLAVDYDWTTSYDSLTTPTQYYYLVTPNRPHPLGITMWPHPIMNTPTQCYYLATPTQTYTKLVGVPYPQHSVHRTRAKHAGVMRVPLHHRDSVRVGLVPGGCTVAGGTGNVCVYVWCVAEVDTNSLTRATLLYFTHILSYHLLSSPSPSFPSSFPPLLHPLPFPPPSPPILPSFPPSFHPPSLCPSLPHSQDAGVGNHWTFDPPITARRFLDIMDHDSSTHIRTTRENTANVWLEYDEHLDTEYDRHLFTGVTA